MHEDYYHNEESVSEYIKLAKDVSGKELIDQLIQVLPENSKLLELGSGPGTDWKILSKTYEVIGSDMSLPFLEHLKSKNPNSIFLHLDAVTLETEMTFDGIYSNKVLHHLSDSELSNSIKRQSEILHPKGVICHSFWKGKGSETFKGMFVNYHEAEDLKTVFIEFFDIISINTYQEFEPEDSLLLIARRK